MKTVFFKKVSIALLVVITVNCSTEDLVSAKEKELIDLKKIKVYEKWQETIDDYDLNKLITEEKNNLSKNLIVTEEKQKKIGKPIYVHYMPWFQSLEVDGFWGQHWTMINRNPDLINSQGKREIASHYYPLIGPYSTNDKDVQQYHLLLMKLCGVDGVIFDWYGQRDVLDFENIRLGMENFITELDKTDLDFAVMYEDRVINEQAKTLLNELQINQAIEDLKYVEQEYFIKENYININEDPLFMIFGPNYIDTPSDWELILESLSTEKSLLTIWSSASKIGEGNSQGEYTWIDENHIETLSGYYNNVIDFKTNIVGGIAYPRFNDYYIEGGWKSNLESDWQITGNQTITFQETFEESLKYEVDFIQVATWNDFGEGTQIEPTFEFGFEHLNLLQSYTEVSYTEDDLKIPYYIYRLRKLYPENATINFLMDIAHNYASKGKVKRAKKIIGLTIFYFGKDLF